MGAVLAEDMGALYRERRGAIRRRLVEFAAVPTEKYFYELCYCLLTPQSSARHAGLAVAALEAANFFESPFDPTPVLRSPRQYIRFHHTKAKRLLKARDQFEAIRGVLVSTIRAEEKRAWLVAHVDGMSLKEASHVLRNIGHRDLAILDRHIFAHLIACKVIRRLPPTITPRRYLNIERRFKRFAEAVGIPMDELDLLFWSAQTGEILK